MTRFSLDCNKTRRRRGTRGGDATHCARRLSLGVDAQADRSAQLCVAVLPARVAAHVDAPDAAKMPAFCAAMMTTPDDVIDIRVSQMTLIGIAVGAATLLIIVVVAAFCGGVARGQRKAAGPQLQFERIN